MSKRMDTYDEVLGDFYVLGNLTIESNSPTIHIDSSASAAILIDRSASSEVAYTVYQTAGTTDWKTGVSQNTGNLQGDEYVFVNSGGNVKVTLEQNGRVGIATVTPLAMLSIYTDPSKNTHGIFVDHQETGAYNAIRAKSKGSSPAVYVDQNGTGSGVYVDSESVVFPAVESYGRYAGSFYQDLSNGHGLSVYRNLAEAGTTPLVYFISDNPADQQPVLYIQQDGTGDIVNFFDGATEVFTILDGGFVGIKTPTPLAEIHITGTGAVVLPVGTTAQRKVIKGAIRYNTTTSKFEGYTGSAWVNFH